MLILNCWAHTQYLLLLLLLIVLSFLDRQPNAVSFLTTLYKPVLQTEGHSVAFYNSARMLALLVM